MEKKKIWWIIGLLFLMYCSALGNYTDFSENYFYDNRLWLGLIDLLICSFAMMFVPFVWRLLNKSRFENSKGKKICKWNSIICFIISVILLATIDIGFIGGVGAIIYYYINKWLFVNETNIVVKHKTKTDKEEKSYTCENCGYPVNASDKRCPNCLLDFEDDNN